MPSVKMNHHSFFLVKNEPNEQNENYKKDWRRSKVRELIVKGYNHYEIANTLQIPRPTITKDIQYLRNQDKENLQNHVQERLPQEYENCMTGINRVLQTNLGDRRKTHRRQNKIASICST